MTIIVFIVWTTECPLQWRRQSDVFIMKKTIRCLHNEDMYCSTNTDVFIKKRSFSNEEYTQLSLQWRRLYLYHTHYLLCRENWVTSSMKKTTIMKVSSFWRKRTILTWRCSRVWIGFDQPGCHRGRFSTLNRSMSNILRMISIVRWSMALL